VLIRPALAALLLVPVLASCGADKTDGASSDADACTYKKDGQEPARDVKLPPAEPDHHGKVAVTMKTSVGDIHITLDAKNKPCTVNSFLSLIEQDYYDKTPCHRMGATAPYFFLQCGDPTGTGYGGPGYTIPDELTGKETYTAGTLAMARTSAPESGGSQFFMMFGDSPFDPDYATFGTFDASSIRILQGVGAKGTDSTEHPVTPVEITDIVVR
jgi:peptidyl-prolyl cis-trans isomerase B (cyclophilin B)